MTEGDAAGTSAPARSPAQERRVRWLARIASVAVRLLARTWRVREVHQASYDAIRNPREPTIYCLWHGEQLPLIAQYRDLGIVVLSSQHADGEIVARVAASLGYTTVRGSSSRGGGRALRGLVRMLREGRHVAITPDGPRGPAYRFEPGALLLAQLADAVLVPLRASAASAWRVRSWDHFLVPKPFTRVTLAVGEPVRVSRDSGDVRDETARFEALMRDLLASNG